MLGIDRRAARYAWSAALVLLLLAALYAVRHTLFVFVVALLFAYLLSPLVDLLDRILPASRTRTPALAIAYLILVAVLVLVGVELGSRVVDQATLLAQRLPDFLSRAAQPAGLPVPQEAQNLKLTILTAIQSQVRQHSQDVVGFIPKVGMKALSYASDLIFVVVVPILSFFFLMDAGIIRQQILELVDEGPRRELVDDIVADVNLLLAQYMRALLILCTATFISYGAFFSIIGVPFGILLAAVAFPLEFIPLVGPLTASVIILLVAGFSGFPHLLWILIFLGAYRLFQDYVLSPRLMSAGMELHPLLVIFGVFAGGELAGVPGTFLSVPVLALLRILYRRFRKARLSARRAPPVAREVA